MEPDARPVEGLGLENSETKENDQECGEYYDLRKTLPRFYRLFEHLNKGERPTPDIMANALDVVERMCSRDALEKVIDGFMRLDGSFAVEVESGRVVLRRRLLHLQIRFNGMRLFRSYAPVVDDNKGSRLAYAPTTPEMIERFPQRVDGVELAKKYLLALLPLTEKEVQSASVMTIKCPERPREVVEQIVGIPGLKSILDNFDIAVDIQSNAPANLLSALGLPAGHCFRGRGWIWDWRHATMSHFGTKPQHLEHLLSRCLSGSEFLWFTLGVLQGKSYEGTWLQRPGQREDPMLLLLRPRQPSKKGPSLPLGPWHEAAQREALEVGECGPDDASLLIQLVPAALGIEAEVRARELQEIIGTGATEVIGSLMTQSDGESQVAGRLAALQLRVPFQSLSSHFPPTLGHIHSLGDMVRRGHEGSRLQALVAAPGAIPHRFPFMEWLENWTLATQQVPEWLKQFVSGRGPLAKMKIRERHITHALATAKSKTEPDVFSALNFKQMIKALKDEDPLPRNLCSLMAGGTMSFEVTPTEELLKSLDALEKLSGALWAIEIYRTRPWYCLGFLSHGSLSGGSVLLGGAGQMCLAGYGLGDVTSVNPLADALQLSVRLLLEDCPLPVAHEDLYSLMIESGADVDTVADWLRIDQESAKLIIFMNQEEHTERRPVSNSEERQIFANIRDLSVAGPWPGSPVVSRADARTAQMEAMELSTALLGLLPGALVPDEGSTAGLLALLKNSMGSPAQHRLRDIAQLARPTLTQPRRWAWDLQIGALEAIEERLETEAFQFASDHDLSLRSEYESVCALSSALLMPHLVAALQLVLAKEFPPWQCLWALRHANAAASRLVKILQAFVETKTVHSITTALSVPVPAPNAGRRHSVQEEAVWAFRKVEDHGESIAGMMIGGVCFDLKHCLLVRLTYKKTELEEDMRARPSPQKPKILKHTQERAQARRHSRMEAEGVKRPQSSRRPSRRASADRRASTQGSSATEEETLAPVLTNPGGEEGFTDPIPGILSEELGPGSTTTGMAILRGWAFALYGWPCPCFEGPEKAERAGLEPYMIDLPLEEQDMETLAAQKQETGKAALHRKPLFLRAFKSVLDALPRDPPGHLLRRNVVPQIRDMMDKIHFYRGNILELAHGFANYMGPLGVTCVESLVSRAQATEFKFKVGLATVKATAALVRAKESVELFRPSDLTALLDSEDWVRNNLRMAWTFESMAKEGIYIAGEGFAKAFQELRKVLGWIDGGRANVMPAVLVFEAHRVEVSVPIFFASPVQPEGQDMQSLVTVVTKVVLSDYENFVRGELQREVSPIDLTLKFRYSPEVRMLPKGTRIRVLRQEDLIFQEQPKRGKKLDESATKADPDPGRKRDSVTVSVNPENAVNSRKDSREEAAKLMDRKVLPNHAATILELSLQRPGYYEIQLDGVKGTVLFDPRPGNYLLTGVFRYAQTQPLLFFEKGGWIDAVVHSVGIGNMHEVYMRDHKTGQRKRHKVSLNELNHAPAKLPLATYNWCAQSYTQDLWMRNHHLQDALTSRSIDLLSVPFAVIQLKDELQESSGELESTDESGSSKESEVDEDMVGVESRSLEPHEQAWKQLLQDISPMPNKVREAGALQRRAVVVWGKPGTGKSTLLRRLVLESLVASAGGLLPVILDAREIVKVICPPGGYCAEGDVLDVLLQSRYKNSQSTYTLLWQALYSRRVLLLVDGGDENDAHGWEFLTHYLHHLCCLGHPVVLFARPLQNSLRYHLKDHFLPTSAYQMGLLSDPLQRLAACARLGALSAEKVQATFRQCEALGRQPSGFALLLSQAELRACNRLERTSSKQEISTMLQGQMVEAAVPSLISFNLSACLPDGAASWVIQLLEVMAMKLYIDDAELLLPESMTKVIESEHPDLEGSWRFVRALILANKFVLVEPCLPPFADERRGKTVMRFVPRLLRDYFLARCFTRYLKEKRVHGLPQAEDIIFDSKWNMFFDLMIEMAATYKVNVSLDLRKKKVLTEAQLTNFTQRLANLEIPVIQLELPPNQVNLLPELRRLLQSAKKSVNHMGLRCNALGEAGAEVLAETLSRCEITFLQLQSCLLGQDGAAALMQAFLREKKTPSKTVTPRKTMKHLALPGQRVEQAEEEPVASPFGDLPVPPTSGFKVSVLDLGGNAIGPEGAEALVPVLQMQHREGGILERLGLDENSLGPRGALALAQGLCKNSVLRGLSLARNRLTDDGVEALAKAMPGGCDRRLRRLVLSCNELTPLTGQFLFENLTAKACPHLERLDLANNALQAEGIWFLSELLQNGLPNLKELDLEYTDVGNAGAGYLADALLTGVPLQRLELGGCRVGAAGAQRLAEALKNPQGCRLTRLGLRGNAIEDEGVTALANSLLEVGSRCDEFERSQKLTSRVSMNAGSMNGSSRTPPRRGESPLADKDGITSTFLTQLQELDVSSNRVGVFGVDALAAVLTGAAKTRLTSLDVSRNSLGRQGAAALAAGLDEGCPLQHLNVSHAKVGDGGAEAIAKGLHRAPKAIVWLQMQENRIGRRGLQLLLQALPKVPGLQRLAASGNLAPDDWPSHVLENLVSANRAGITKPSVELLSPSGRRWLGYRILHHNTSFGSLDPRFATVLQLEEATDGSKTVRRTSVLKVAD
ncbi:unnamed protein product [Durusdinium trenchii]|uniref:NACHT domain-containing protein n=3 Tax=Durusdinium trenchii TaxID=1381693 RepID=A0ABP0J439_9DINO